MHSHKYDFSTICNALMDIIIFVPEEFLKNNNLDKGIMHLVDESQQMNLIASATKTAPKLVLGGSALNTSRGLRALGHKIHFSGSVCNDEYGEKIKQKLSEIGIDSSLSEINSKDLMTGTSLILITPDSERTMATCLGASTHYDATILENSSIEDSKVFHFCGYQWDKENQIVTIKNAMEKAKNSGTLISFDVADPFVVERHRDAFLDIIKNYADIVFCNEKEAQLLFNEHDPMKNATSLGQIAKIWALKLGAKGSVVGNASNKVTIPVYETKAVDTTAAGDIYAAGFLHGLISQGVKKDMALDDLEKAGHFASKGASYIVSQVGADINRSDFMKSLQ